MELSKSESVGNAWTFGRFRLIPTRQLLLRDAVPVEIGSRALEILTVLVRRSGELVAKHELIAAVWPDTFVDESNLKVNVCSLRRSLGDTRKHPEYIATVAGRGYRFVAPVHSAIVTPAIVAPAAAPQVAVTIVTAGASPWHSCRQPIPGHGHSSTSPAPR